MDNYSAGEVVSVLKEVALAAGTLLREKIDKKSSVSEKSSFKDLVTDTDMKIQSFVVERLTERYPEACFVSEERNNSREELSAKLVFVIDPIDGTSNFIKGIRYCCVSIGCLFYGEPVAGVVYNPCTEEMFSAAKGRGAFLNDRLIQVSCETLRESLVLFGTSPYDTKMIQDTLHKVERLYTNCLDVRRLGSAALDICSVACGRVGLYFEGKLSLWDYLAAAVILSEAGGTICDYNGAQLSLSLEKTSVIAGNERIIAESGLLKR